MLYGNYFRPQNSTELLSGDFNKGKVNRWAAMTLLSRVYLYKGEYNEALTMAENAIKGAEKKATLFGQTKNIQPHGAMTHQHPILVKYYSKLSI